MAEAAVEDRVAQRFYCHMCQIQFESTAASNFTCPQCSDGFVEQLETNVQGTENDDTYMSDDDETYPMVNLESIFNFPTEDRPTNRGRYSIDSSRRRRYAVHHRIRPRSLSRLVRSQLNFENLIQEVIVNLGVGVNGVNFMGGNGNMQFFLGNPGDYAWGREGLDAIVTQLLNQMDTSGPPPLAKDVIDAIPTVEVTNEQVESKLQCSVCWDDFKLGEKVRQLACLHVYHEPCIRPWLELHGTCPICRQDLGNDENLGGRMDETAEANTYNTLQQLFQSVQQAGNISLYSPGSSNPNDTGSSSSNNGGDPRNCE